MTYLPRPSVDRIRQDVDEIYTLASESLQNAATDAERRKAFRIALLQGFEAGVNAQRDVLRNRASDPSQDDSTPSDENSAPGGVWKPKH